MGGHGFGKNARDVVLGIEREKPHTRWKSDDMNLSVDDRITESIYEEIGKVTGTNSDELKRGYKVPFGEAWPSNAGRAEDGSVNKDLWRQMLGQVLRRWCGLEMDEETVDWMKNDTTYVITLKEWIKPRYLDKNDGPGDPCLNMPAG